jgi:hypothetical protein
LKPAIDAGWVADVDRAFAEEEVRLAVFRTQLAEGGPGALCFLQVKGSGEPSSDLLDSLKEVQRDEDQCAVWPEFKPISAVRSDADMTDVIDNETARPGIIIRVDTIKWLGPRQCEVEGGYYAGPLAASGNTFQVELREGRWEVVGARMDWIS